VAERYYDAVEYLPPAVSSKLAKITIVGMRHHGAAFDKIIAASKRPAKDQCLFLVADVNNKFDANAVMLHNGKVKLGYVAAAEAARVKAVLDDLSKASGQDHVLVVKHAEVRRPGDFSWCTATNVTAVGHVYERIARKFAQKQGD
jgi:hypothetical protein